MVHKSSIPLYWRLKKSKYNLIGTKCTSCGSVYFPPRPLCPKCRRRGSLEDFKFSGKGKIVSYTVIRMAPEGFETQTPYAVAVIQLEEGTNVTGQVVGDVDKIKTGMAVRSVFRKIHEDGDSGLIHYGLKFEIAD